MAEYRQMRGVLRLTNAENPLLFRVEIWLLNDKVNRNKWRYENLAEHMGGFAGTPILCAYKRGGKIGGGHDFGMTRDPETGEEVPSFTGAEDERIVGTLSENTADLRMEARDGATWIVGSGTLWKWYARELVDKIKRRTEQGRAVEVSIETLVSESRMEGDVEVEERYEILGTTILGDDVQPAVAGARIKALRALRGEFEGLKLRAAAYEGPNSNKPQKTNKEGVKTTLKKFSKAQMREFEKRCKGYVVLNAREAEDEEGAVLLTLCSATSCEFYSYKMLADAAFDPSKLDAVRVMADLENKDSIDVGETMERMLSALTAENKVLTEQNEKLNADLSAARAEIKTKDEVEAKRRVSAAKKAATEELARINANRDENCKIAESCVSAVLADAEAGAYSECCDPKTGEWCGEARVQAAVRDAAMQEQMKQDEKRQNAARVNKTYAFEQNGGMRDNSADKNPIDETYAALEKMGGGK